MLRYLGKEMYCIKTIARNILVEKNWLENISLLLLISWFGSELYLREKNGGSFFLVFYLFQVHIIFGGGWYVRTHHSVYSLFRRVNYVPSSENY